MSQRDDLMPHQQAIAEVSAALQARGYRYGDDATCNAAVGWALAMKGITPELPPRAEHWNGPELQITGIQRYGIRWNGPQSPLAVPMNDGYWVPFHLVHAVVTRKVPTKAMIAAAAQEYDEWAKENQGTDECIEAMLRKALAV